MKIIFLDIDGVLNHERFYQQRLERMAAGEKLAYPQSEFCPESMQHLNTLCENTGAKVVISSTWRLGKEVSELQQLLESVGFTGEVIDKTPRFNSAYSLRGNEILAWIKQNEALVGDYHRFKSYVILDDDSDMLYWQRDNFILIDRFVGITGGTVFRASKLLV